MRTIALTRAVALLAVLSTLMLPSVARAQDIGGPIIPAEPGGISSGLLVHGHAEIKAMPDIAYVTVGITSQSKEAAWATRDDAERSQAVVAALKGAGIADKDIQTESYILQPQYDYSGHNGPTVTGYQATNSIRVTVRSLAKVGPVIDTAIKAGANNINGVTFDLSDRRHVEGETLVAAIANARSKADLMAGAAGVSLGNLLRISEDNAPIVEPVAFGGMVMAANASVAATPVSPQELTVTADVSAVYAISPAK